MTSAAKFHVVPMGPAPVVWSQDIPHLPAKDIVSGAHNHIRRHSGAGVTPPISSPTKVLGNNHDLFIGANELASLYVKAGGPESLASPSVTDIKLQTASFAQTLGLHQQPASRPAMNFPARPRVSPTIKRM